jgi:DnaA family protein
MEQFVLALAPPPAPTFDNYIAGPNRVAVQAVRALVTGTFAHRVLYLWGSPGTGCTHLLRAAMQAWQATARPGSYVSARELSDRTPIAPTALLAIDDLQQLPPAAAQRVFEFFTTARGHDSRVLLAADRSPAALACRDDLRTRFASGVTFELAPLDDAHKRAALQAHAAARAMRLPEGLLEYVLQRVARDMGTQIAVLDALDRYSLSTKRMLTLPLAREVLQRLENEA